MQTMDNHVRRNSAGARMTTRVPKVLPSETVASIQSLLRKNSRSLDTINYIYVIDNADKLIGTLSIRELYHHAPNVRIGDVCAKDHLVTLPSDARQERAAYLSIKNSLKAIPIVDDKNTLLGVISSDDLLSIIYRNTHDALMRATGISRHEATDNIMTLPLRTSFRHRVPWLVIGLVGGLAASGIIGFFKETLEANLILAAFIPLIVYMSGAIAVQTQTLIIRDMVIDQRMNTARYATRQFSIIFLISAVCGILLFFSGSILGVPSAVTSVLAWSLFFAMVSSIGSGIIIPLLLRRVQLDPANASGPLVTIIQDILSILIYFTVASLFL